MADLKLGWKPMQTTKVETPKAKAPPPPPPPPPQVRRPSDLFVSGQQVQRQQQLLGSHSASSLRTERLGDGSANCLERAMNLAGPGDSLVLLSDKQDGVGHALVRRPDGSVIDPNFPTVTYQSVGQWQAMNPRYGDPRPVPYGDMKKVLSSPPGPQRDALINKLGLTDVARRMVADDPVSVGGSGGLTVTNTGQVTFTGTLSLQNSEGAFESGNISGKVSSGPLAEAEVSLTFNPGTPRPDGTYEVTIGVGSTAGMQSEAELNLGPFGLTGGQQAGATATQEYKLFLTEAQLRQVAAGTYSLPTLADPMALPVGGSMTLSTGAFTNQSGGISYGPLSLSSETTQTRGYGMGVERTGDNTVRVTVGPQESIERRLELGLSFGDIASAHIGRDSSVTEGNTVSVEFDLSTAEGKAAYETFLRSGQLPTQQGAGITDIYHEQTLSYQGALDAGINIGEVVDLGYQFWSEDLTYTTRTDDGVTTVMANGHTSTGNGFEVNFTQNPDGTQTLDAISLEMQVPGRTDPVKISLTGPEGLRSMQQVAFQQMQNLVLGTLHESFKDDYPELANASQEEFRQWLQANALPDSRYYNLSLAPGDAGFSYTNWAGAYNAHDDARGWPPIPNLTNALLTLEEPLDMDIAADFFYGLNGIGGPNDLLSPSDIGHGSMPSLFDSGLASNPPGVTVEGY